MKENLIVIFSLAFVFTSIGVPFYFGIKLDDRASRACMPFVWEGRENVDGKLFAICRDLDGGLQLREAP